MIVLIDILHKNKKNGEEIPLLKQYYQTFDKLLDPNLKEGELIRAILGNRLGFLLRINESWTHKRLELIFVDDKSRRNLWDVAWDSYILNHKFSVKRFSLLKSQYKKGINRLRSASRNFSYDGRKRLINHLINAYLIEVDDLDKDSLIEYMFLQSNSEIRRMIWQTLSSFINHINKIEDDEWRKRLFKRYFELISYIIKYLNEKSSIEYKDTLEKLDLFGFIFSRIQKLGKDQ